MSQHSANGRSHHFETFHNANGGPRLAMRIAADINYLNTLQDNEGMCAGSFNTLSIDQELEHQYRQRWKIE